MKQKVIVDLDNSIISPTRDGNVPQTITVAKRVKGEYIEGSVPMVQEVAEHYVRLTALPEELRQRVITALQVNNAYR